jgi:organic radical activating enzyme
MLNGQWPGHGCEYCRDVEAAGGTSDRLIHLGKDHDDWTPPEFETNPVALSVTPRLVEIFVNNTCNLKCVYCDPMLSSSIQKENQKFGHYYNKKLDILINDYEPELPNREQYVDEFFIWLGNNHKALKRLHLLGGEPFLEKEIDLLFDFFEEHPSPDLILNIISNLMVKEKIFEKQIDRLANLTERGLLGKPHITGSIDGWGPMSEFTRFGLDLTVFERNIEYCLNHNVDIDIGLNQTLVATTIKETVPLLEKALQWNIKPHYFKFQLNTDPCKTFLDLGIWGGDFWRKDFENIIDFMKNNNLAYYDHYLGLFKTIENKQRDEFQIKRFVTYFDELDRRRGTNWKELFPFLEV